MFLEDLGAVSGGGEKSERARKNFCKKKIRPKKSQERAVKIRIAGFKNLQLRSFSGKNLSLCFKTRPFWVKILAENLTKKKSEPQRSNSTIYEPQHNFTVLVHRFQTKTPSKI